MQASTIQTAPRNTWLTGVMFTCIAAVVWAAMETLGSFMTSMRSPFMIVWMRYATHLLFMLIVLAPRYGTQLVRTQHPFKQISRGLLMLVMPTCFFVAASRAPLAAVWSVFWVAPAMILGLAWLVLRERSGPPQWAAVTVGLVATLFLLRPQPAALQAAAIPALAMAMSFALYMVLTRSLHAEHTFTNLFYSAAGVFVPLGLAAPLFWQTPTLHDGVILAIIGLLGFVLLYTLDRAYHQATAPAMAPFLYLEPVVTLGLGALLFGVHPGKLALLGIIIIAGLIVGLGYLYRRAHHLYAPSEKVLV